LTDRKGVSSRTELAERDFQSNRTSSAAERFLQERNWLGEIGCEIRRELPWLQHCFRQDFCCQLLRKVQRRPEWRTMSKPTTWFRRSITGHTDTSRGNISTGTFTDIRIGMAIGTTIALITRMTTTFITVHR
jgi:hypothetical protein